VEHRLDTAFSAQKALAQGGIDSEVEFVGTKDELLGIVARGPGKPFVPSAKHRGTRSRAMICFSITLRD